MTCVCGLSTGHDLRQREGSVRGGAWPDVRRSFRPAPRRQDYGRYRGQSEDLQHALFRPGTRNIHLLQPSGRRLDVFRTPLCPRLSVFRLGFDPLPLPFRPYSHNQNLLSSIVCLLCCPRRSYTSSERPHEARSTRSFPKACSFLTFRLPTRSRSGWL